MLNFLRHSWGACDWAVTGLRSPELEAAREKLTKHKKGLWQEGKRPAKGIRWKRGVTFIRCDGGKKNLFNGKCHGSIPSPSRCPLFLPCRLVLLTSWAKAHRAVLGLWTQNTMFMGCAIINILQGAGVVQVGSVYRRTKRWFVLPTPFSWNF